ncbi:MAG TPA: hypothetical protein VJA22_02720, partial [Patescibacteria group bacterium]|nr:hypothetical protein [Patescibacteria group bacterium]
EYIWSQVIDDRSGTAIAKDGSCPRSVGQTSQEAVGIPCHIEQHPTSLHVYENQEITFIVERCNDALYISCEICKQLGIIIPTETGAETAE